LPPIDYVDEDRFEEISLEPIRARRPRREERSATPVRKRRRPDGTEAFKCGHCRAFIGPTVSGGRFRNHCPLCLWSKHVDRSHPGDRASDCRSLMRPIGVTTRPNGEQLLIHRCLGCGAERRNRVAADDNMLACMRLAPVSPGRSEPEEEMRSA
jgi:hypothetical protein